MKSLPTLACPVYDVAWHPSQHMLAMCAYGHGQRIFLYVHEQDPSEAVPIDLEEMDTSSRAVVTGPRIQHEDGADLVDERAEAYYNEYMGRIYQESEALFGA